MFSTVRLTCPSTGQDVVPDETGRARPRFVAPTASRYADLAMKSNEPMLIRADELVAYPSVDDISLLLPSEAWHRAGQRDGDADRKGHAPLTIDAETSHYDRAAANESANVEMSSAFATIAPALRNLTRIAPGDFPDPHTVWIDALHDGIAQYEAYSFLRPLAGQRVLQIGGKGTHAIKFLLAGAAEAWLVTPMLGEAVLARSLADAAGVGSRLNAVVGAGEHLPYPDSTFAAAYSGGSLHHMDVALAMSEVSRVLVPRGRFAAVDPWRTPLHGIGTRIFGKRERGVDCRPLSSSRVDASSAPMLDIRISKHGAIARYLLIVADKLGYRMSARDAWRTAHLDDRAADRLGIRNILGSSAAVLACRRERRDPS
jgi:SAM-dependent methyltransferase